ncbi:ATP-binding protein [Caulobacter sp. RL271]|jgi:predicted ATPase/DNA-binding winged helix-turn-helix (wHTH) protein|uniref:Helix-turn-helix transcriptional regulator n=1 Tax=Caulobacter segnis TaxID=88688 RepID=A0ABY4ZZM5_9CAUL|nr:winged helix-turn-helix domain-containing protein [Caulobacter segnis]USQ98120.1 helix-turn-helix transcriptional regulator [Caulobacter segnis]
MTLQFEQPRSFAFGPFVLNPEQQMLVEDETPVALGGRAFDLLTALVEQPGVVLSKSELLARGWPGLAVEEANLKVNIASLRRALGEKAGSLQYIATVIGRGYRFVAPVRTSQPGRAVAERRPVGGQSNLPPAIAGIVGRAGDIAQIQKGLEADRLLSIVGAGGMGKTTVAVAVAEGFAGQVSDGAWFVDLASVDDAAQAPAAIARALGLSTQGADARAELLDHLRGRRLLLVLDNCEHLIEAVASCAQQLLAEAPQVRILATSREPLRINGERVYRLPPLDAPPIEESLQAAALLAFPAAQLFIERAAARNRAFQVEDEDAPIVAEICQRLDGLALAIELAANSASAFGVRELLGLLDGRFRQLGGLRSWPDRHQTMTAAIDWSYNLLSEEERVVLRRLSVFPTTFTLRSACRIAETGCESTSPIETLAALVDKSLVTAELGGSAVSYRLLDTTRTYAQRKLAESDEDQWVRQRYADSLNADN